MPHAFHHRLTTGEVCALRLSASHSPVDYLAPPSAPVIRYNAVADSFEIVINGQRVCSSSKPKVVCALLSGERFEPGFIKTVLDPINPPDELHLDPMERERLRSLRAENAAQVRFAAREREEAVRRSVLAPVAAPADLTLDDLLDAL
jgi:hypothetical protein